MKLTTVILPFAAALLCAGCGVSSNYVESSAASGSYQVVVVKDFKYKSSEASSNGPALTKEFSIVLSEELQGLRKFTKVTTGTYSGRALRIEGDVTLLDEGNSALRIGVGMGTGKSHFFCTTRFIDNASGKLLGTFEVERSSKNGLAGIADNFPMVRRSTAGDIAEKATDFAPAN